MLRSLLDVVGKAWAGGRRTFGPFLVRLKNALAPLIVGALVAGGLLLARHFVVLDEPLIPASRWESASLVALLLSVFSAFVLYYDYPVGYQDLKLGAFRYAVVYWLVPTFQIIAALVAVLTLSALSTQVVATCLYLFLFIPWDVFIYFASPKRGPRPNEFQESVGDYLKNIDLPTFMAFGILTYFALFLFKDGDTFGEPINAFMAGVVGSQSLAGLTLVVTKTWVKLWQNPAAQDVGPSQTSLAQVSAPDPSAPSPP